MRIERLELDTSSNRVDLRLHPRITFIVGLGAAERHALGTEILSSLRQGRPGLSVTIVEDSGRLIEVYRPLDGRPTVRDAVTGDDLTDGYLHYGTVNVLSIDPLPEGKEGATSEELLRIGDQSSACPCSPDSASQAQLERLSDLDQSELWDAALALAQAESDLEIHPNPGPDNQRLRLISNQARNTWLKLVGATTLEWAVENRAEIRDLSRLRKAVQDQPVDLTPPSTDAFEAFLPFLHQHLLKVEHVYGQCVPVIIDHRFELRADDPTDDSAEIDLTSKLLSMHCDNVQLILMTDKTPLINRFANDPQNATVLFLGEAAIPEQVDSSPGEDLTASAH